MRTFSYEPREGFPIIVNEDQIRQEFYPVWLQQLYKKYTSKAYVDEVYEFEDCVEDWKMIHCAQEKNNENPR